MKIGILTYHAVANFGAQLQTLSTIGFLKKMGHDPIVLNWYPKDLEYRYKNQVPIEQFENSILFAENNFPISKRCSTEEELIVEIERLNLDLIIAGSDALFKYQPEKLRRHFSLRKFKYIISPPRVSVEGLNGNAFWGNFISKLKKKIPAKVYAVSSQNCPYHLMNRTEREEMKKYLSNYDFISVRDKWTQQMIFKITNKNNIPIHPDPVFSFNRNCYIEIPSRKEILEKYNLPEHYILLSFSHYLINIKYINSIATELIEQGFYPVSLPMPERTLDIQNCKKIQLPLSPIEWYALIIYSNGYIGERMHPIVVSLQNNIPFFSFDQYGIKRKRNFYSKTFFDKEASKTFLILKEANLLDNYHSIYESSELPTPSDVIAKLSAFDIKKCSLFSLKKETEYIQAMSNLIPFDK